MTYDFDTLVRVSRRYIQVFSDPPRQKLELRRLAASDLAQILLSKVVSSHLANSDNTVWRVSIQMQQAEMHFNYFSLGTFFSLQQIKNGWVMVLT